MIVSGMPVGPIQAVCYIVGCEETRQAAVIDPGDEAGRILEKIETDGLTLRYIINTHGHFDHVGANREVKAATGAELLIHPLDAPMLARLSETAAMFGMHSENSPDADKMLEAGDQFKVGNIEFTVIHTPGHTPGGISLHTEGKVFVGDTLFAGSIGRSDLPGGDHQTLITSIRGQLYPLDDETVVYPGHMGTTTIGREKQFNPFVRA